MEALSALLPFAMIFAVMYFLMIRPRRRQMESHRQMVEAIGVGDEVVMIGGEIGRIQTMTDDEVQLEIAPNVTMRYVKNAIRDRYGHEAEEAEVPDEDEA